jgi:hypothetical protein
MEGGWKGDGRGMEGGWKGIDREVERAEIVYFLRTAADRVVKVRPGGAKADSGGGGARKSMKNSFVFFSPLALFFVSPSPFPSPLFVAE